MDYVVKWRLTEEAEPKSQVCATEAAAASVAFDVIGQGHVHLVWIEDDAGNVIAGDAEVRRRMNEHG